MESLNGQASLKGRRSGSYTPSRTFGTGRRCLACGTILSRYNPNSHCYAHSTREVLSATVANRRGRPRTVDRDKVRGLFLQGHSMAEISRVLGIAKSTTGRILDATH